jgi:hypothetical protein
MNNINQGNNDKRRLDDAPRLVTAQVFTYLYGGRLYRYNYKCDKNYTEEGKRSDEESDEELRALEKYLDTLY